MCTFESIAGYKTEKEELRKLCDILKNERLYTQKGARIPKGLILYGGSGTGKTLFAKVLAAECNMPLQIVDLTDVTRPQSICRKIKNAFETAKSYGRHAMVFMDEIDKILPNVAERYVSDQSKVILTQLLTLIDGIESSGEIFFVATCNDYEDIPQSLVRPGRIDRKINIDFPNVTSRTEILDLYMKKTLCAFEQSAADIAVLCTGFSCAALETLINECVLATDSDNYVSSRMVYDRIEQISQEDVSRNVKMAERRLNAAHQVGHYIVGQVLHRSECALSRDGYNVCNAFYDAFLSADSDYDYDEDDCDDDGEQSESEDSVYFVKDDFVDLFAVLCGGRVGEALFYTGITDKCRSDMERTRWLFVNMAESGMFGVELMFNRNAQSALRYPCDVEDKLNDLYFNMLGDAEKLAADILKANQKLGTALIRMLMTDKVLSEKQLDKVIQEVGGFAVPTLSGELRVRH